MFVLDRYVLFGVEEVKVDVLNDTVLTVLPSVVYDQ